MRTVSVPHHSLPTRTATASPDALTRALLSLLFGVGLFLLLLIGVAAGYSYYHAGTIYPGVSVAGIDLSGRSPAEAAALLTHSITYPETGKIVFQYDGRSWIAKPSELGLFMDPETSAMAAFTLGRKGNPVLRVLSQFEAWYFGLDLPPLMVYDQRLAQTYLSHIAAEVDRPVVEASLAIQGVEVSAKPGEIGRTVDILATLGPLETQMRSLADGLLPVTVVETPPAIIDVTAAAEAARRILSEPLVLNLPEAAEGDPGPTWTIEPQQLAGLLTIQRVDGPGGPAYQVGLNAEGLRPFLQGLAPSLARNPADARFLFNDEIGDLELAQPAVIGRALDIDATVQIINESLAAGQHSLDLALVITPPALTDTATGASLGIRELVASESTYFYGSSPARIHNIQTAAARFNGVMVPPGATFSMADILGDVSLDNGYAEALIIFGGRTIEGVGGGVCQVSTTLFRTVFFGGYPVDERWSHAYRVGYYEQDSAGRANSRYAGLDATVYVPVVDFKFTNDTPYWILMETHSTNSSLTWSFYSTSDGRSVEWATTGLQNIKDPPEPKYVESDKLDAGEIKQVDWEVAGADVTIERTVLRGGEVLREDNFTTHYQPWASIFEYGPGTDGIPKQSDDNG